MKSCYPFTHVYGNIFGHTTIFAVFLIYTINLKSYSSWKDTITNLRFDPFNAVGKIDIDYMRLEQDPDYEAKQEALKVFQIVNGDAEGDKVGFISHNASVSIVMDPIDGDDKCYLIMPKDNSKQWIYAIQDVYFTPGATYKISYDIAFASVGTDDAILAGSKKGSAMANMQYPDPGGSNHNVGATSKAFEAGAGWTHCEGTYTIPSNFDLTGQNRFTIYANPIDEKGLGFYLDNVVVEEINNLEGKGQVHVNGIVWSARSSDGSVFKKDERVTVEKIDGVKLIVK